MDGPAGMQPADGVCGNISMTGSAAHPYRLVTGILSRLLKIYSSFRLYTHTPCLSIQDNIIHTPRGDIHTKHVHTTNGWTSHLLASMREKIVPVRGHMTAQRAGMGLDDGWLGTRSFVLYPSASEDQWDHLTQQPPNPATFDEKPHAEFTFGATLRRWLFSSPMCWMPNASPLIRVQIQLVLRLRVQEHACNAVVLGCHGYAESSTFSPFPVPGPTTILPWINSSDAGITDIHFDWCTSNTGH
ncbi:hypothetical protein EV421DRAFT_1905214 [Armillaria borealis]|uniref:Uncharacterized protein n=1 Tax=Armillaria borealis TaxID=47425 RepID=A0AA39MNW1_9AGAR|nr:hypothetical protein EV421DRAFT_1905214 [Armillaria borealis]